MFHDFGVFGILAMVFRGLIGIAILIGVVLLIIWAIRRLSAPAASVATDPKEIAKARYAKGEISREEYQQILTDLA